VVELSILVEFRFLILLGWASFFVTVEPQPFEASKGGK
jgi:hypothetical protein